MQKWYCEHCTAISIICYLLLSQYCENKTTIEHTTRATLRAQHCEYNTASATRYVTCAVLIRFNCNEIEINANSCRFRRCFCYYSCFYFFFYFSPALTTFANASFASVASVASVASIADVTSVASVAFVASVASVVSAYKLLWLGYKYFKKLMQCLKNFFLFYNYFLIVTQSYYRIVGIS